VKLEEFCSAQGIELSALAEEVESAVGLHPDDVLLVAGSVVEGLGNSRSDLDLLLLTPRDESLFPSREIALVAGRSLVDMRVLRFAHVEDLIDRLEQWQRLPWDVTHAVSFELQERVLLHRLAHARVVWSASRGEAPQPSGEGLMRLKLHVARQMSRTVQIDLAGHAETEDYESMTFAAQDLLGHAVDALLAGHGFSNPLPKWRSRLLSFVPSDWEASANLRPLGVTASKRVWSLHRAPSRAGSQECLEHALRIAAFARAVFVWAERRLVLKARGLDVTDWPSLSSTTADDPLPYLDVDVDFELSDEAVMVGRLNDFGETLRLSPHEFAIALLCDGTTTSREAEAFVRTKVGGHAGAGVAAEVISRLESVGFLHGGRRDTKRSEDLPLEAHK
jgi:hypothetical protein